MMCAIQSRTLSCSSYCICRNLTDGNSDGYCFFLSFLFPTQSTRTNTYLCVGDIVLKFVRAMPSKIIRSFASG